MVVGVGWWLSGVRRGVGGGGCGWVVGGGGGGASVTSNLHNFLTICVIMVVWVGVGWEVVGVGGCGVVGGGGGCGWVVVGGGGGGASVTSNLHNFLSICVIVMTFSVL